MGMALSLIEAARTVGCNRSTILRAIKSGKLSGTREETTGAWMIDPSELSRVWPDAAALGNAAADARSRTDDALAELRELRARFADAQEQIVDLRTRLDQSETERRQAQERLVALLSDKRGARRLWWPWRR
jgi:chromosome segregation ATPase